MGNDSRLRSVGGRADPGPAGRFRDRCRLGPLHPVARDLTPSAPGRPSAAAGVIPPSGSRRVLRKEANRQLSADSGRSTGQRASGQSYLEEPFEVVWRFKPKTAADAREWVFRRISPPMISTT